MKAFFHFLTSIPGLLLLATLLFTTAIQPGWLHTADKKARQFVAHRLQLDLLESGNHSASPAAEKLRAHPGIPPRTEPGTLAQNPPKTLAAAKADVQHEVRQWVESRSISWWTEKSTVMVAGLTLLLLLPRLGGLAAAVIAVSLSTLIALGQLYGALTTQVWLPLLPAFVLLAAGAPFAIGWGIRRRQRINLRANLSTCGVALAEHYLQQGQLEEALTVLDSCPATIAVLDQYCSIARQYQTQRHADNAEEVYRQVLSCKPGHQLAQQGLQALAPVNSQTVVEGTSLAALATTQKLTHLPEHAMKNTVIGRYRITRELGRGAMGVVYLGQDPKIARQVAIKTLSFAHLEPAEIKPLKERFFREAEAAGRLSHPAIVTVYDAGEDHDLAYIAMDYVDGEPLSRYVSAHQLLPIDTVNQIIADVADALHYAHQQRIVHRDVKPANILYSARTGLLKVSDFGIARISDNTQTKTGDILGSPLYMPPELFSGSRATAAADIFSLGVTYYQLLTGDMPFRGDSVAQLAYQVVNGKHRSVRELRPELSAATVRIINRALQKQPGKRFGDAAEMAAAIRKTLTKKRQQVA